MKSKYSIPWTCRHCGATGVFTTSGFETVPEIPHIGREVALEVLVRSIIADHDQTDEARQAGCVSVPVFLTPTDLYAPESVREMNLEELGSVL